MWVHVCMYKYVNVFMSIIKHVCIHVIHTQCWRSSLFVCLCISECVCVSLRLSVYLWVCLCFAHFNFSVDHIYCFIYSLDVAFSFHDQFLRLRLRNDEKSISNTHVNTITLPCILLNILRVLTPLSSFSSSHSNPHRIPNGLTRHSYFSVLSQSILCINLSSSFSLHYFHSYFHPRLLCICILHIFIFFLLFLYWSFLSSLNVLFCYYSTLRRPNCQFSPCGMRNLRSRFSTFCKLNPFTLQQATSKRSSIYWAHGVNGNQHRWWFMLTLLALGKVSCPSLTTTS